MGDDDAVPLAAGDLGGQELAAVPREVLLGGDQQLGVGVELHELAGELLQHVVGHDVHRLLDQAGLLHLHAGGGHREGLAGPDGVGQQRVAGAHAAPDGVLLVRPQRDRLVHAGEVEVRAVEQAGPQVVVGVVVEPHQPLGAFGVGEHPGAELLLDLLLLLAGGQRRLLVDDALCRGSPRDRVVDHRRLHVEGQFEQPGAVGPGRAVLGGRGDRLLGGVVGVDAPHRVFLQVPDLDR